MSSASRSAVIDAAKALACTAIVWHHLAFYGPMSDTLQQALPQLSNWLVQYARMAVQIFLVLGGYLAASRLAPHGHGRTSQALSRIGGRFERLVIPYAAALVVVVLINAAVRPWLNDPAVAEADPGLMQLLSHALLLHGVLGQESLSAGVWYVAIDFQLFALFTLMLAAIHGLSLWARGHFGWRWHGPITLAQSLTVALVAVSLLGFNRNSDWDAWALYFFGAYGLGVLAYWAVQSPRKKQAALWCALIVVLAGGALWVQWRDRVALAALTALLLVPAQRGAWAQRWLDMGPLHFLGRISYSVFLVHFALCLLVNAVVAAFWPDSITAAAAGLFSAWCFSVLCGWLLYEGVERRAPTWRLSLRWQAGLMGAGLASALLS